MLRLRRILFPTDFTPCAERAFHEAAALADRFEAALHVLHVAVPRRAPVDASGFDVEVTSADVSEQLHLPPPPRRTPTHIVQADLPDTSILHGIVRYARMHEIDLIVMGTHGRHGVDRVVLGSVAEEVVRTAPCPVLTVRGATTEGTGRAARRFLVPVDFSEHARLALTYAKELASASGAALDVLHVVEPAVMPTVYGLEPMASGAGDLRDRTRMRLEQLVRETPGAAVPAEVHVELGDPARSIVDFADRHGTEQIVISTHGRTGIERLLVGSVAEKVVGLARCPVFTAKSFGRSLLQLPTPAETAA